MMRYLLMICLLLFSITLTDSLINDANSYSELSWWGKASISLFFSVLVFIIFFPLVSILKDKIKKK